LLSIQHDVGKGSWEGSYSAQDGMVGLRGLWNFGWGKSTNADSDTEKEKERGNEREGEKEGGDDRMNEEEETMEGELKGRFSAGGEVYFSAKQRSFGSGSYLLPINTLNAPLARAVIQFRWTVADVE
jgi:distribution and morphology protein 10